MLPEYAFQTKGRMRGPFNKYWFKLCATIDRLQTWRKGAHLVAYVEWEIRGREFVNCNCAYGCPCQFNALPTHRHCMGVAGIQIEQGSFGAT